MRRLKTLLKWPSILWLILALFQFGASLIFYLHGNWMGTIPLAITALGTLIRWFTIPEPREDSSTKREVSTNFFIQPDAGVTLSADEYSQIIPDISRNIGVTCSEAGDGFYNLMRNGNTYNFFIKSDQNDNASDDSKPKNVLKFVISFSQRKMQMNKSDFQNKLRDFIRLVKELSTQVKRRPGFRNIQTAGAIKIWQFTPPDGVYDIQFKRKLNNLFRAKFLDTVKLSSGDEECIFERASTEFVFPLKRFPGILKNMADIIWLSE